MTMMMNENLRLRHRREAILGGGHPSGHVTRVPEDGKKLSPVESVSII